MNDNASATASKSRPNPSSLMPVWWRIIQVYGLEIHVYQLPHPLRGGTCPRRRAPIAVATTVVPVEAYMLANLKEF